MAVELLPDGSTFKKLTPTETGALDRYYKRGRGDLLDTVIPSLVPSILFAGVATAGIVVAWSYLKEQDLPTSNDVSNWLGGGVASVVSGAYSNNPKTPAEITLADGSKRQLSRCQRWESDAVDWKILNDKFNSFLGDKIGTLIQATHGLSIIKNMKREGCSKPTAFTQAQWDEG